jgi:hypothetical protein
MESSSRPDNGTSRIPMLFHPVPTLPQALENRAVKHQARQDDLLVRAVARVWKARERGVLLDRFKAVRTVKETWETWKRRLRQQKERQGLYSKH